jgi:hypothetical protein
MHSTWSIDDLDMYRQDRNIGSVPAFERRLDAAPAPPGILK